MRQPPLATAVLVLLVAAHAAAQHQNAGYRDTPVLPGSHWRVHDADRPHPPIVTPAPAGEPVLAPKDAIVLFDGKSLDQWRGNEGKQAGWTVADGCMTVNGTGDLVTAREFGDCQLHVEWSAPLPVSGESQGRGNSGVFFFARYEVQVLDSYDNVTYADGQAAALYGQYPPLVNCCRKPGEWQTYDIVFVAPRFDADGKLQAPARATVLHNGIVVQLDRPLLGATAHRAVAVYAAHAPRGPIKLQDHGNPVRYRNIWIRELDLAGDEPPATAGATPKGSDRE